MADAIYGPKTEALVYAPSVQDTTDMEAATTAITATAEAAGTGNANYNSALTLPDPDDTRIEVTQILTRLAVTIDSMTAGTLYCRVYVDTQVAGRLVFDTSWTTTGAKLAVSKTNKDTVSAAFDLLKDGAAHTFYFFFWVNAGNAVLSLVELWEGVGSALTNSYTEYPLKINHTGLLTVVYYFITRVGTGTAATRFYLNSVGGNWDSGTYTGWDSALDGSEGVARTHLMSNPQIGIGGSVATDLNYISKICVALRK